jgi:uncharacterized protein YqjF (DUF2071 family)
MKTMPTVLGAEGRTPSLEQRLAVRARPPERAAMYQSWRELLFLHWSMDPAAIQAGLPAGLSVDTYEGQAWVGVVPFFMRRIRPWWSPPLPGVSNFQELNCRTYVVDEAGTPGVWFYSLEANCRPAVWWGRKFFSLPYVQARMSHSWNRQTGRVEFASQRRGEPQRVASRFVYEPRGAQAPCEPGTLEFFLVERYVLFADRGEGRLMRGIVHHPPYQVSDVRVETAETGVIAANGLPQPHTAPDHCLVSRGVDVEVFALESLNNPLESSL